MPKYNFLRVSETPLIAWSKFVGETGVSETGVGEQAPIRLLQTEV